MIMSRLKRGLLITPKDIRVITGCAVSTARREHRLVRDILGKTKRRLTVKEYCTYFEFDYAEVVEYINPFR